MFPEVSLGNPTKISQKIQGFFLTLPAIPSEISLDIQKKIVIELLLNICNELFSKLLLGFFLENLQRFLWDNIPRIHSNVFQNIFLWVSCLNCFENASVSIFQKFFQSSCRHSLRNFFKDCSRKPCTAILRKSPADSFRNFFSNAFRKLALRIVSVISPKFPLELISVILLINFANLLQTLPQKYICRFLLEFFKRIVIDFLFWNSSRFLLVFHHGNIESKLFFRFSFRKSSLQLFRQKFIEIHSKIPLGISLCIFLEIPQFPTGILIQRTSKKSTWNVQKILFWFFPELTLNACRRCSFMDSFMNSFSHFHKNSIRDLLSKLFKIFLRNFLKIYW